MTFCIGAVFSEMTFCTGGEAIRVSTILSDVKEQEITSIGMLLLGSALRVPRKRCIRILSSEVEMLTM